MSEPLVVVGNGMAAARFVDELSARALGRYSVAVVGEEPRLAYNRVLLSSVLAGEIVSGELELKPRGWYERQGITLSFGCSATSFFPRRPRRVAHGWPTGTFFDPLSA